MQTQTQVQKAGEEMNQNKDLLNLASPTELIEKHIPDEDINAIWISFVSESGKKYMAVHVFKHFQGPYVLLSSVDKDEDDFWKVANLLATEMNSETETQIYPRLPEDICMVIKMNNLPKEDRQLWVAGKSVTFYAKNFFEVKIHAVYLLSETQKKFYKNM